MNKFYLKFNNSSTAINGIIFTFFAFLNQGLNFLLLIALTNFLSPDMYGKLNLFNTYILFINILITLNSNGLVGVNYFKVTINHTRDTIYSIIIIGLLLSLSLILIIVNTATLIEGLCRFQYIYFILAILYCYFNNISSLNLILWRSEQKPIQFGLYSFGIVFLNVLLTILLITVYKIEWEARIYAQFIISCAFVVISFIFLLKRKYIIPIRIPKLKNILECIKFGVPLIPNAIAWWAIQGVNRIIINKYFNLIYVGYFSFASNICNLIQIVGTSFYQSFQVDIYANLKKPRSMAVPYLRNLSIKIALIYLIILIIFLLLSYILIPTFFPDYSSSLSLFPPLCIGAFFSNMQQLFISYLFYFSKTRQIMCINVICTTIGITLSYFLTKYSIILTAYLICIIHVLIFVLTFIYSQKLYPLYFRVIFKHNSSRLLNKSKDK